jgi:DNA primase
MIPDRLNFKILKATVSIERVLAARCPSVHLQRRRHRLVGPCPVHGGDKPDAFVVHPEKNVWYCFSCCRGGGDVVEFVRRLYRVEHREAAEILACIVEGSAPRAAAPSLPPQPVETFRPFTRRLFLDPDVPMLRAKGILLDTARTFEAGAWHGPGFLEGCVGVRLHDPLGNPLGYIGRHIQHDRVERFGKWKLPRRFPKSRILFNAHRVQQALRGGTFAVVECPWGTMRLHQLGVPAVSLLGTTLSETQRRLLAQADTPVLLLDGDRAGRDAARAIHQVLPRSMTIDLPPGKDPDDLDDSQLHALLAPFFFF